MSPPSLPCGCPCISRPPCPRAIALLPLCLSSPRCSQLPTHGCLHGHRLHLLSLLTLPSTESTGSRSRASRGSLCPRWRPRTSRKRAPSDGKGPAPSAMPAPDPRDHGAVRDAPAVRRGAVDREAGDGGRGPLRCEGS
jgi:hypothetical protein